MDVSSNAFSARALKEKHSFNVDVVVKNKSKCGLAWSVLLSTTNTPHYSFPKHFFLLFIRLFEIHQFSVFFLGKDLKKVFLTSDFPCKNDTQQRHFYRTMENMNRSKIVRFPANFTPEITLKVS